MKTSKLIPAFVSTLPLMAILYSCSTFYLKKPADTNLDFWITERAERQEFEEKGCTLLPGWFGAAEYLDHRYVAEESGDMAVAPAVHVTYLLSGYPDTKDEWAVTRIHITDPEITVYGLTMNSTNTEIEGRMADMTDKFHYSEVNDVLHISFNVGKCVFDFSSSAINIGVATTNKEEIIY